jgi:hypothetical protein
MGEPVNGEESRTQELMGELRMVFAGRGNLVDSIIPPVVFLVLNSLVGFSAALWGSLGAAAALGIYRLARRQAFTYALGGVGLVLVSVAVARLLGRSEGFFLPELVRGGFTVVLCLVSVVVRRPLVAWTSYLARRWPWQWYWHPKVRPAYSEVTLAWGAYFGLRLLIQYQLFQSGQGQVLGWIQLLTGWPATVALLVTSYLYGLWRLGNLAGPSVAEFKDGAPPPWEGQKRGF